MIKYLFILLFPFIANSQTKIISITHDTTVRDIISSYDHFTHIITFKTPPHDTVTWHRCWIFFNCKSVYSIIHDTTKAIRDSVKHYDTIYRTFKVTHDSAISIETDSTITTLIGFTPYALAQSYGIKVSHRVFFIGDVVYKQDTSYTIFLTLRNYKQGVNIPAEDYYAIDNEELHDTSRDIVGYCDTLAMAAASLSNVTNGGFTLPIYYWYWCKTHDTAFFHYNINDNAKWSLVSGKLNSRIAKQNYELNVIKSLGIDANIHIYVSNINQFLGLKRMIEYIKAYTGHGVLSNESGIYTNDVSLLKGLVQLARDTQMKVMVFYSGINNGSQFNVAYPISKIMFIQAVQ